MVTPDDLFCPGAPLPHQHRVWRQLLCQRGAPSPTTSNSPTTALPVKLTGGSAQQPGGTPASKGWGLEPSAVSRLPTPAFLLGSQTRPSPLVGSSGEV